MAIIDETVADAVARAVNLAARQVTSTTATAATSLVTSALSSSATANSTPSTSGTMDPTSSTTDSSSSPTTTNTNNNTGSSSPLLFFVALGFGVVFTNLWIIVGVKYCFRYNARNRQMRGLDENGEPINLEAVPTRPHRRRREKKLMSMDEVNEKFPMQKYKMWVAARTRDGLPNAGGVSVPPSHAGSVRSVDGVVPELPSKERDSEDRPETSATSNIPEEPTVEAVETARPDSTSGRPRENNAARLTQTQTAGSIVTKDPDEHDHDHDHDNISDDEDDDGHIDAAIPPELVGTSGDTCAICIDTLEDDDDVRGLTCGHAFHAVCLDPWLTNRRACCPLCKADYYTPKPRPPPADGDPNNPTSPHGTDPSRNNGRLNLPRQPAGTLGGWTFRRTPQVVIAGRMRPANAQTGSRRNAQRHQENRNRTPMAEAQPVQNQGFMARAFSRLPNANGIMSRLRPAAQRSTAPENNSVPGTDNATPSQLEAGVRTSDATPRSS